MKHFIEVIEDADELAFFKDIDGFDIAMLLDFYTRAEYRNGLRLEHKGFQNVRRKDALKRLFMGFYLVAKDDRYIRHLTVLFVQFNHIILNYSHFSVTIKNEWLYQPAICCIYRGVEG